MGYLYIGLAALAALHAFFFGHWLFVNGNRPGALAVFSFSLLCLALPIYHLLTAP